MKINLNNVFYSLDISYTGILLYIFLCTDNSFYMINRMFGIKIELWFIKQRNSIGFNSLSKSNSINEENYSNNYNLNIFVNVMQWLIFKHVSINWFKVKCKLHINNILIKSSCYW